MTTMMEEACSGPRLLFAGTFGVQSHLDHGQLALLRTGSALDTLTGFAWSSS